MHLLLLVDKIFGEAVFFLSTDQLTNRQKHRHIHMSNPNRDDISWDAQCAATWQTFWMTVTAILKVTEAQSTVTEAESTVKETVRTVAEGENTGYDMLDPRNLEDFPTMKRAKRSKNDNDSKSQK